MKPKEALVKDGFLPPGSENKRGRLSGEAIERCKALAAQGWRIEGYEVSQSAKTDESPVVKKVAASDPNRIPDVPEPFRDEDSVQAMAGTTKIGNRTVCNICRSSLMYCPCPSPRVWLDHETEVVVHFAPK